MASDPADGYARPSLRRDLGRLRLSFRPWRGALTLALVLSVCAALLEVAILMCIAATVSALSAGQASLERSVLGVSIDVSLTQLAMITLAIVVVRGVVDLALTSVKGRTETSYDAALRQQVADAFLDADWALQSAEQSGGLQASLTTYVSMSRTLLTKSIDLFVATVSFAVMVGAGMLSGGFVTVAVIVFMGLVALALRPFVTANRRSSLLQRDATGAFSNQVNETVAMTREIRVMGISGAIRHRLSEDIARLERANLISSNANYRLASIQTLVTYMAVAGGLVALVVADVADPQPYAAMVLLLYRAMVYARGIQSTYQGAVGALPYLEELDDRLERYREARDHRGLVQLEAIDEVRFEDVGFSYDGERDALLGVTMSVGAGRAVGVVGPSGSGKSTFVQLLLGLRTPTIGQVSVDGVAVQDVDPACWTRHVSFVPQESTLFDETAIDNVICFRPDISRDDAVEALCAARVLDELLALPDGLDTLVGEGGRRLSGGQRQRVCIARALAGRPALLVLDEPTSALDLPSEEAIRQTLDAVKATMGLVIVAHRLSTLRICDQIAVINDGHLEAFADREVLEADNVYFGQAVALAKLA